MKKLLIGLGILFLSTGVANAIDAIVTLDYVHFRGHMGDLFSGSIISLNAVSGTVSITISPNAGEILHCDIQTISSGMGSIAVYESPTVTFVGSSVISMQNNNRRAGKTLSTVVSSNVTITALGTIIRAQTQTPVGVYTYGSSMGSRYELILDPLKKYYIAYLPNGVTQSVSIILNMYKD